MKKTRARNDEQRTVPRLGASVLILLLFCFPCLVSAADKPLKKTSLIPLWSPQAQFAGYYVALEKGIYARHGLDMTIIPGGPDMPPDQFLRSGKADFAILWLAAAMELRASGMRLVNVAQLVPRTSMMLVARKSSGISTPADLKGRKVGVWGGLLALPAEVFFKQYGLKVRKVPQTYTVNLFLRGGVDAASAMWYNEYHTILLSGLEPDELVVFPLREQGVNFPEDGLYTLEKTLRRDPEVVSSFVQASLEGWRYAFEHPDEAVEITVKYMREAGTPANRVHQRWMLDRMRDLMLPRESSASPGRLEQKDYEAVGAVLQEQGVIKTVPPFSAFTRREDAAH